MLSVLSALLLLKLLPLPKVTDTETTAIKPELLFIPYGYHNGDQTKYDELVRKAHAIISSQADSPTT